MELPELILVTGGAGFLGSILVSTLLEHGYRVRSLDALRHGDPSSLLLWWGNPRFEFVHGDIRDPAVRAAAVEGAHAVFHLAAIVGDPACAREPELAREVNLEATLELLADAENASVERFVFASTCSNYGRVNGDGFADEEFALNPISLYAETKVAAELEMIDGARRLASTILRFATLYGTSSRMRFDLTVNEFTRELALDQELVVYGEQFWRPYVHVRDAAGAVVRVLGAPIQDCTGQVYNVGDSGENYRKLDIVELLRRRFPDGRVEFVHREEDPRDYRVSFEKFAETFGFDPQWSVESGIDEVATLLRSGLVQDPFAARYRN